MKDGVETIRWACPQSNIGLIFGPHLVEKMAAKKINSIICEKWLFQIGWV